MLLVSNVAEGFCWARTAERQASRLRSRYLQAVLKQDVGYFDQSEEGSVTSQVVLSVSAHTLLIQEVLSEKVSYLTDLPKLLSRIFHGDVKFC